MVTEMELQAVLATRVIRVKLTNEDVARLRRIAQAERRPPQDQAAWFLEQAIREWENHESRMANGGGREEC